jgi:hypothetical protein
VPPVVPPSGTTYGEGIFTSPGSFPDGAVISGVGIGKTILKGKLNFGSGQVIRDMTIGDAGMSAVHNRAGATNTVFERCQFRGGGGTPISVNSNVITLGMTSESCDHITFRDCNVERNLGPSDGARASFCNVAILANGSSASGAYVDSITFERCHFGVSNGVAIGSPCFNFLCWTNYSGTPRLAHHGWSNVVVTDSIFEAADQTTVDIADYPLQSNANVRASGPFTMTGCTIMGAGKNPALPYGNGIAIEAPHDVLIENNTIYRCAEMALGCGSGSGYSYGAIIRNNRFILDEDTFTVDDRAPAIGLGGTTMTFSGNIINVNAGWFPMRLDELTDSTITGNSIHDSRTSAIDMMVLEWTKNLTITGNTLTCGWTTDPRIYESAYGGSTNTNNTIANNTFNVGSRSLVSEMNGAAGNTLTPNTVT